jgi:hypothetical protein
MTNPVCATRTGKIARTKARWRAPLQAAQPDATCTDTHSARGAMSELTCKMPGSNAPGSKTGSKRRVSLFACVACKEPLLASDQAHLIHVFAMGFGETTGLHQSNGPALPFKPGGT